MGSSQKYWQYARDCARWASETKEEDDREILDRMAKAWVHGALADEDVAREALYEAQGSISLLTPQSKSPDQRKSASGAKSG